MSAPVDTNKKNKLLIISQDVIDCHMAGPGLRYSAMARFLADSLQVTLAAPEGSDPGIAGVSFFTYGKDTRWLKAEALVADFILVSGAMPRQFPFLVKCNARLVVDLYDPMLFENLYYYEDEKSSLRTRHIADDLDTINILAQAGDFFICGSERQRDLWLGLLLANHRINRLDVPGDPEFRKLIDVVGMGIPTRNLAGGGWLKGQHPQVPTKAKIVLWGGGIWNWLDPLTLIKSWPAVIQQIPQVRLVFLGTRHPNPAVPQHDMAQKALDLAGQIGELDKTILFFDWISTTEREGLLSEADVGVICHPQSIETHFALRTRMLDYFWAQLPVVTSEGDVLSEVVRQHGVGWVVSPNDPEALAVALINALTCQRAEIAQNYQPVLAAYDWSNQLRPLLDYFIEQSGNTRPVKRKKPIQMRLAYRIKRKLSRLFHCMTVKA